MTEMTATNTTANTTERLNNLKLQIEEGKAQKARAEANLETYTKQLDETKEEIRTLGVEPTSKALDAEIARLDAEIAESLAEAEGLLNPADGNIGV